MAVLTTSWQLLAQTYLGNSHGDLYVRLYGYYSQQDIANNRSYVIFQARAYFTGNWIRDNQGSGGISTGSSTGGASGSCTYPTNGETVIATAEHWISHAADGTLSVLGEAYLNFPNWGWYGAASAWASLPQIPRQATLKTAPDFNDEENPTITYSNPAGNAVTKLEACISLTGAIADIPYRSINKTGSSYTFNLTDEERAVLRQATVSGSNNRTVHFFLATTIGTTVYRSHIAKKFTVINADPILSPTVIDIGTHSTQLTGDNNKFIKGYSIAKVTTGAEAVKEASLVSQTITCNNRTIHNESEATIDPVENGTFTFTATDNRGNTSSRTVVKDVINYIKLTCKLDAKTPTIDGDFDFSAVGNYFSGSFGAVNNSLKVEWRFKVSGEEYPKDDNGNNIWNSFTNITFTDTGYKASANISGLDYQTLYMIQVRAADEIYPAYITTAEYSVRALPVFDWGENDFNFNIPVFNKGNPMGYYPIGGICTSHENINPGELFGGTWELIRPFYGGELLAYSTTWNTRDSETRFMQDSSNGFSDIFAGDNTSNHICNYMPDILTKSSGTIWVQTKGVVGLVEVNVEIGGHSGTGCHGIWFKMDNKNALPQSVVLTGGSFQGLYTDNNKLYSGTSCRYFYNIADDDTGSNFFVNPIWTPYGGNFQACSSGIKSFLHVKAYAKGVTNYVWKRIA